MNIASSSDEGGEQATPIKTPGTSNGRGSPLGSSFRDSRSNDPRRRRNTHDSQNAAADLSLDRPPPATAIEVAAVVRAATNNYFMLSVVPGGDPKKNIPLVAKMAAFNSIKYAGSNETTERPWSERWSWATAPASGRATARLRSDLWRDRSDANSRWGRRLANGAGGPIACCQSLSFRTADPDDAREGLESPDPLPGDPVHGESFPKFISGNHRPFLGGRIVLGPDVRQLIGSAVGICLPAPLVSVAMASDLPVTVTVLLWLLWAASLGSLLWTALSDPGIVTRRKDDVEVPENIVVPVELADIKGRRGAKVKAAAAKAAWKAIPRTKEHAPSRRLAQERYQTAHKAALSENRVLPFTLLWPFSIVTGKSKAVEARQLFVRRMLFAQYRLQIEALVAAAHHLNVSGAGQRSGNCAIVSLAIALLKSSERFKNNRHRLAALQSRQVPLCSCGSLLVSRAEVREWRRGHFAIATPTDVLDPFGTSVVSTAQRGHHQYCLAYHSVGSIGGENEFSLLSLALDSVTGFTTNSAEAHCGTYLDTVTAELPEGLAKRLRLLLTRTAQRMLAESGVTEGESDKGCNQFKGRLLNPCMSESEANHSMEVARSRLRRLGATAVVPVVAKEVVLRYCYYCCVYRGPRTHHCRRCQNCVDLFDHHCPWTGTCIGGKNYHCFLYFLLSLNSYLLLAMVACIVGPAVRSIDHSIDIAAALLDQYCFPVILFVLLALAGNTILSLLTYHLYIVAIGVTTLEHIRQSWRVPTPDGLAKSLPPQPVSDDDPETSLSETSDAVSSGSGSDSDHDTQAYAQAEQAARNAGLPQEAIIAKVEEMKRAARSARVDVKHQRKVAKAAKAKARSKRPIKIKNVWSLGGTFSNCWSRWSGQIEPKVMSREYRRVLKDEILLLDGPDNLYGDSDAEDPSAAYNGMLEAGVRRLDDLVLEVPPERVSPAAALFAGNRYATSGEYSDADEADNAATTFLVDQLGEYDAAAAPLRSTDGSPPAQPAPFRGEEDGYPQPRYTDLIPQHGPHGAPVDIKMVPTKRKSKDKKEAKRTEAGGCEKAVKETQSTPPLSSPAATSTAERIASAPALTAFRRTPSHGKGKDEPFKSIAEYSQELESKEGSSGGSEVPSTDDEGSLQLSLFSTRSQSQFRSSIVGREGSVSQPLEINNLHMGSLSGSGVEPLTPAEPVPSRRGTGGPQFMQRHSSVVASRSAQTPHLANHTTPSQDMRSSEDGSEHSSTRLPVPHRNGPMYPDDILMATQRGGLGEVVEALDIGSPAHTQDDELEGSPGYSPQIRMQTPPEHDDLAFPDRGLDDVTVAGDAQRHLL